MDNYAFIFQGGGGGEGREDSETSYPMGPEIACTMLLQTVLPQKNIRLKRFHLSTKYIARVVYKNFNLTLLRLINWNQK